MDDRVEASGLPTLAHDEGADLVERPVPADRLPEHHLLRGPEAEEGSQEPRGCRSGDPGPLREVGDPAPGAGAPRGRRGRRGPRQRLRRDDVQGQARGPGDHLLFLLRGRPGASGPRAQVPRLRRALELSTYFRINAMDTGQFERTLIIADPGAYVSYLEGCTAPIRDTNQLHAAVVELIALDDAEIKYSTIQNWYPGDKQGKGGIYNFVTKRGKCLGVNSKISWTQVETGSSITWKYPSCILQGDNSVGEFYSVALANNYQQADTGTKMIHIGRNTKSNIVSKGISAGHGQNSYRGQVRIQKGATGARN